MPPPLVQRIIIDNRGLRKGYREAGQSAKKYSSDSRAATARVERDTKKLGATIKASIGIAAVAAYMLLKKAVDVAFKSAVKFQKGMAEVSTLVKTSEVDMRSLGRSVLQAFKDIPVSLGKLTQGLYQTISAGIDAGSAIDVLRVAAKAAVGGVTDTATAVDGMTSIINGFGLSAADATDVADKMFVAVKRGKTTFGELSANIGKVASIAHEAGVSLDDVLSATAALTLQGVPTAEAMTQISAVLISATRNADKFKQELGIDLPKELGERGLGGALSLVAEKAKEADVTLIKLFGETEAVRAATALAGTAGNAYAETLADMGTSAGALDGAFQKMNDTMDATWQKIKNRVSAAMVDLGTKALPVVNRQLERFMRLLGMAGSPQENALALMERMGAKGPELLRFKVSLDRTNLRRDLVEIQKEIADASGELDLTIRDKTLRERFADLKRDRSGISSLFSGQGFQFGGGLMESIVSPLEKKIDGSSIDFVGSSIDDLQGALSQAQEEASELAKEILNLSETPGVEKELELLNDLQFAYTDTIATIENVITLKRIEAEATKILEQSEKDAYNAAKQRLAAQSGGASADLPPVSNRLPTTYQRPLLGEQGDNVLTTGISRRAIENALHGIENLEKKYEAFQVVVDTISGRVLSGQMRIEQGFVNQGAAAISAADGLSALFNELMASGDLNTSQMQELTALYVGLMHNVQGVADEATGGLKDLSKEGQKAAKFISGQLARAWVRAADGVAAMLRSIGILDEKTAALTGSALAAAEAYAELLSVKDAISAGTLVGAAAGAATAGASIGLVTAGIGIVSSIAGLFKGGDSQVDAIKENTRRIEDAIRELGDQMREAPDLPSTLVDAIQEAYGAALFQSTAIGPGNLDGADTTDVEETRTLYEALFDYLDTSGQDTSAMRDTIGALLDTLGDPFRDGSIDPVTGQYLPGDAFTAAQSDLATQNILIQALIAQMNEPGAHNRGTVPGALGYAQSLVGFGALDEAGGMAQLLSDLSGQSLGALAGFLDQMAGFDPGTTEGQAEIRRIIAEVARLSADGQLDSGRSSPNDVDDILSALQGFLGGVESGGAEVGGTSIVRQIQQSITTFQAAEGIVLDEERNWILSQTREDIRAIVQSVEAIAAASSASVLSPVAQRVAGALSIENLNIHPTAGITDEMIPEIMAGFESYLRERLI